jgi:hypothetical protein
MSRTIRHSLTWLLPTFALAALAWLAWPILPAQADLSSAPCAGNICERELWAGGRAVNVSWTEHVDPNGLFKVRFDADPYPATGEQIAYIVYGAPKFDQATAYHRFDAGTFLLQEELVNAGKTSYERRQISGCPTGCQVDMVMQFRYSSLPPGQYTFGVVILQLGGQVSQEGLTFYVDNAATQNSDEGDSLDAVLQYATPPYYTCADYNGSTPIDNDLSLLANCRDPQCDGRPGNAAEPFDPLQQCETPEQSCAGGFDNDGDGLVDCEDPDCNGRCGEWDNYGAQVCEAYCQYRNETGAIGSITVLDGSTPLNADALSPCMDGFDNDGDNRMDCNDNRVESLTGAATFYTVMSGASGYEQAKAAAGGQLAMCWRHDEFGCPETEAGRCDDNIDDDHDQSYALDQNYDSNGATGESCRDYDCAGDPACPQRETEVIGGGTDPDQCFDGFDNDLDRLTDCADPDCIGVESSDGRICTDTEFDLGQRINYCWDFVGSQPFDNDGDGPPNCEDSDCRRKFGKCQWCPAIEDYQYQACSDGLDNDAGEGIDCRDPDCRDQVGRLDGAAYCRDGNEAAGAFAADQCSDGLNNDETPTDSVTDCADSDCTGVLVSVPAGFSPYVCSPGGETGALCNDQGDNDGDDTPNDLGIDCLDRDCWTGQGLCHPKDWVNAPEIEVPDYTGPQLIKPGGTVTANVMTKSRVNGQHTIRIVGSSEYPDFAVFIGTATDDTYAYRYASETNCTFTAEENGSPAPPGVYSVKAVDEKAFMIFRKGGTARRPNLLLSCDLPSEPTLEQPFTVSLSSTLVSGGAEFGEIIVGNRVYEGNQPTIVRVEVEGEDMVNDVLTVPYGAFRDFRVVPDEPFDGSDGQPPEPIQTSGISKCTLQLDCPGPDCAAWTSAESNTDGDCVIKPTQASSTNRLTFKRRRASDVGAGPLSITAFAEDGAANEGPVSAPYLLTVNVIPHSDPLRIIEPGTSGPAAPTLSPFINSNSNSKLGLRARFEAAENLGGYGMATCMVEVFRRNETGPGSLLTVPFSLAMTSLASSHIATCEGTIDLADLVRSGVLQDQNRDYNDEPAADRWHYYVRVGVQDGASPPNTAWTKKREFYVCETVPGPDQNDEVNNLCHWVDFDNDGATEGSYTNLYTSVPGFDDPDEVAWRACDNCVGVPNASQADFNMDGIGDECAKQGRCELDRSRVCDYFSYGYDPADSQTCLNREYPYKAASPALTNMCCADPDDPLCCPMPSLVQPGLCRFVTDSTLVTDGGVPVKCTNVLQCGDGNPATYYCDRPALPADDGLCYDFTGLAPVPGDREPDGITDSCRFDSECADHGAQFVCAGTFGTCLDLTTGYPLASASGSVTERCISHQDCGDGDPNNYACIQQQACQPEWGVCSVTGFVCFDDSECFLPGQCYVTATGEPYLDGSLNPVECREDSECFGAIGVGAEADYFCDGGERCVGLVFPWLETQRGNVFSGLNIRSQEVPPTSRYNATFCITAKGYISDQPGPDGQETVFRSQICPKGEELRELDKTSELAIPEGPFYGTVLGRLDVPGLLAGKYGEVRDSDDGFSDAADVLALSGQPLAGRVYVINGDLTIDDGMQFVDSLDPEVPGNGTIVVVGGNLTINKDSVYNTSNASAISSITQIASVAWVVLEDPDTKTGGNIYIDGEVTELVGAFYAGGQGGLYTVAPPDTDSPYELTVRGLVMARQFHLSRAFRSDDRGSEQFIYDGRALLNPPPGYQDLTKSLPIYGLAPPLP